MFVRSKLLALYLPVLVACNTPPARGSAVSPALARVGATEITQADLDRAIAREPEAARERYKLPAARRQLLEGLVRFEVMSQAAEAAGWMKDPEVIRAYKQQGVARFVQDKIGTSTSAESISDADVRKYYEDNRDAQFSQPPAAHVHQLVVKTKAKADELLAQARKAPADAAVFARLVTEHSTDELSKATRGDLGFIDRRSPHAPAIIKAALALAAPGDLSPPIETNAGWAVLRLVAKRSEAVQSLADVETLVRQTLQRQRREAALDALMAGAQAAAKVHYLNP